MSACPRVDVLAQPSLLRRGLFTTLSASSDLHVRLVERWGSTLSPSAPAVVVVGGACKAAWKGIDDPVGGEDGLPARILALCPTVTPDAAAGLLAAHVDGVICSEDAPETVLSRVLAVASGEVATSRRDLVSRLRRASGSPRGDIRLTVREQEVLELVAHGADNREIAERLYLASGTVRNVVSSLYLKIGVRSRGEAVAWAWRSGSAGGGEDES